jgi:hypothetical protein
MIAWARPVHSSVAVAARDRDRSSILVVHADLWVRALGQVLLDAGYTVLEASNGANGLRAVARSRPNAIMVGANYPRPAMPTFVEAVQAEYTSHGIGISVLLAYFRTPVGRSATVNS